MNEKKEHIERGARVEPCPDCGINPHRKRDKYFKNNITLCANAYCKNTKYFTGFIQFIADAKWNIWARKKKAIACAHGKERER